MNIVEIIKDCIANPRFVNDYDLEEGTISGPSKGETISISGFTGYNGKQNSIISNQQNGGPKAKEIDTKLARLYMRIWGIMGKFLSEGVYQGNCMVLMPVGYFYPNENTGKCVFSPMMEILEKYQFRIDEDESNVRPELREVFYILINYCRFQTIKFLLVQLLLRMIAVQTKILSKLF